MNVHNQEHGWVGDPKLSLNVSLSACNNKSYQSLLSFLIRYFRVNTLAILGMPKHTCQYQVKIVIQNSKHLRSLSLQTYHNDLKYFKHCKFVKTIVELIQSFERLICIKNQNKLIYNP